MQSFIIKLTQKSKTVHTHTDTQTDIIFLPLGSIIVRDYLYSHGQKTSNGINVTYFHLYVYLLHLNVSEMKTRHPKVDSIFLKLTLNSF